MNLLLSHADSCFLLGTVQSSPSNPAQPDWKVWEQSRPLVFKRVTEPFSQARCWDESGCPPPRLRLGLETAASEVSDFTEMPS
ncbi:hypothetical protein DPEC_G00263870 [Dallia pectoralis]|uniref:Uncharacterized protein n=1 Tax=Dallia pectoralis TaxID=75939 RepID=A0ACC2FSC7_DALPE|nr:hypothetical protein DPEC_G00263870 [Dallia pectoralis]